jgi:ABC-type transporter Mla maintaining outer membrane lipid asymmetry ATPase subunit MlaF
VDVLPGRKKILDELEEGVLRGSTLLLLGPLGIGKTSILGVLAWGERHRQRAERLVRRGVRNQ